MTKRLSALIERARHHVMTDDEAEAQRLSWAWGNLAIENPAITREDLRRAAERKDGQA